MASLGATVKNINDTKMKLAKSFQLYFLLLIFISGISYGQENQDRHKDFIKVYSTQSWLRPPFPKIEIEISNKQICYRNILPPIDNMNEKHLDSYDSWDTVPDCREIEIIDYDSITNFILTSGLLNIDLNYTRPDTTGGVICFKSGGGTYRYIIETSRGELDLLISGSVDFRLPDILVEFDELFKRVSHRYKNRNEGKPATSRVGKGEFHP